MDKKTREEQIKKLKDSMVDVMNTEAGVVIVEFIKDLCGYGKSQISMGGNGEISTINTMYNEARLNVYLELRKYMTKNHKIKVELKEEN